MDCPMSLYGVDKVLREIIQNPTAREAYGANAETYLEGRELTALERAALIERDFQGLYRLGAHPFLLVGFVPTQCPPAERAVAMKTYQQSLTGLGYPDYST
jgi:hypothetical protein